MNWRKVCAHDLYCGLLRPRYLWAMLIFMVPCIMNQIDLNFLGYRATWMDYMMGCFEGVNRVDPKTFQFPTMWLLIMGAGLFMNLDYLLGDLSLSGQQIIVRSGNRRGWYFSKCVWNLCSTALYLLLGSLGVLVFTILMGGGSLCGKFPNGNGGVLSRALQYRFSDSRGRGPFYDAPFAIPPLGRLEYGANALVSVLQTHSQLPAVYEPAYGCGIYLQSLGAGQRCHGATKRYAQLLHGSIRRKICHSCGGYYFIVCGDWLFAIQEDRYFSRCGIGGTNGNYRKICNKVY